MVGAAVTALIAILWMIIGAVAGLAIGDAIAPAFGFRHMEGMSAIFAVFFAAPVGAVGGAAFALWLARKYAAQRRNIASYSLLAIVLAVTAGFVFEWATNDMLDRPSNLVFEIRLPPGAPLPKWDAITGHLRSKGEDGSLIQAYGGGGIGRDGDRPVLQGEVAIWRQTKDRVVTFRIGDGPVHLFRIDHPAKPVETNAMTPWSRADLIEEGKATRKPNESDAIEMRYRVYKGY
jgi:phosphate/sulfate permease